MRNGYIIRDRFRGDLIPISEILQESYFGSFSWSVTVLVYDFFLFGGS